MVTYTLTKIRVPFEGWQWMLAAADGRSSPFGIYKTKRAAKADAKAHGLKVREGSPR